MRAFSWKAKKFKGGNYASSCTFYWYICTWALWSILRFEPLKQNFLRESDHYWRAKKTRISLHQKDLTIESAQVDGQDCAFTVNDEEEAVFVEVPATGKVNLTLTYTGKITDNMTGIYPSYYTVDGLKKEVISTQFESHFAREAFPSVDEPEAKATFDLAVKFDQEEGEIVLF